MPEASIKMKLIEKPEPPASNECCGSGSCCPCVWDYYREQMAIWQQQQLQQHLQQNDQQQEQQS
jgi:hypothetical protein